MDRGITNITMAEAGKFVDEDLLNKVGDLLNEADVKVATVHFTLAYLLADSMAQDCQDPRDIAVGVMSLQQYMMQIATSIYQHDRKKGAN